MTRYEQLRRAAIFDRRLQVTANPLRSLPHTYAEDIAGVRFALKTIAATGVGVRARVLHYIDGVRVAQQTFMRRLEEVCK